MGFRDTLELAEKLRKHISTFPGLGIKPENFGLDDLGNGTAMSLQFNAGQTLEEYLDGLKIIRQPFTLFYAAGVTVRDKNINKAAMIGKLNNIGLWLENTPLPDLGEQVNVIKLEQVTQASIYEQDDKAVTYMAQYILDYELYKKKED